MFKALGLGMMIIVLEYLVPTVFSEIVKTAIAFLQGAQISISAASQLASAASHIPNSLTSSPSR
jgi:hypothetical protein